MKLYTGTKTIKARPMTRLEFDKYCAKNTHDVKDEPGYLVEYEASANNPGNHPGHAGYISWSPAKVFEDAYHGNGDLTFGQALDVLKKGQHMRIRRKCWNPKVFLFLLPPGMVPTSVIHDETLREVIAACVGGETFEACGSIRKFLEDSKIMTGWNPSQEDMFAEDWEVCV